MALGALAAVRAAERTDVRIGGFDNIGAVRQAILDGQILVTADQHGDQLAVYGIETALELLQGVSAPETVWRRRELSGIAKRPWM